LKKIIVFAPYYYPHVGGLENYARELNKYLVSRGYSITLVTAELPKNTARHEGLEGIDIFRIPSFEIIPNYPIPNFFSLKTYKTIYTIFQNQNDICISHTRFFLISLLALFYAKTKRIRWVHFEHGSDFVKLNNSFSSILAKLYDITLGKLVLRSSSQNVAVSKAAASFVNKFDSRAVKIINFGLDKNDPIFQSRVDNKNNIRDVARVTYVGRLIDGKGVDILLEAAASIRKNEVEYWIVGDGPQRKNLEMLTKKLGIQKIVKFWGQQDHARTIELLRESDIFVLPSYTEGLSVTMIEAAFCNTAIISTDVGGAPELIEDGISGYLFKPGDSAKLTSLIQDLVLDERKRRAFSEKLRKKTVNNFGWDKNFGKLIEIIEEI
jgi:glycosyltransferase involved in cell wall biosynthesis